MKCPNIRHTDKLLTLVLALALTPLGAHAGLITYKFTGIFPSSGPGPSAVNFSGSLSYNTAADPFTQFQTDGVPLCQDRCRLFLRAFV